jgi:hypothetical protein
MSDDDEAKSTWRKYLLDSDRQIKSWIDGINGVAKDEIKEQGFTNFKANPTSPKYATSGKLVKLDDVIKAIHMMHANVVLHVLPNEIRKGLEGVARSTATTTTGWTSAYFLAKEVVAKRVVSFFTSIYSFFSAMQDNADVESKLRAAGEDARDDLARDNRLKQVKKRGKVRDVHSRHKTEKHKRHWKGCKSL